jgi:hypothetical protein
MSPVPTPPLSRQDVLALLASLPNASHLDLPGCFLRGADLTGLDLAGANLAGADLGAAQLVQADLRGANLSGANLIGATLDRADLTGATLARADLQAASALGTCLVGADLRGARLNSADLRGADLQDATLQDATASGTRFSQAVPPGVLVPAVDVFAGGRAQSTLDLESFFAAEVVIEEEAVEPESGPGLRLTYARMPLQAHALAQLLAALVDLHALAWLIQTGRLADLPPASPADPANQATYGSEGERTDPATSAELAQQAGLVVANLGQGATLDVTVDTGSERLAEALRAGLLAASEDADSAPAAQAQLAAAAMLPLLAPDLGPEDDARVVASLVAALRPFVALSRQGTLTAQRAPLLADPADILADLTLHAWL